MLRLPRRCYREAFRYYFLRHIDTFVDSDFTWEKFDNAYNNELANDLGNLVQRLATLCHKNNFRFDDNLKIKLKEDFKNLMDEFRFKEAFDLIWEDIQAINRQINDDQPWVLAKQNETKKLQEVLASEVFNLLSATEHLEPFLPKTTSKIKQIFVGEIEPPKEPLFPKTK